MQQRVKTVTILSGAALSSATYIGDGKLTGVQMPAAWTAADLTFQGSLDGVTYADMFDASGSQVDIPAAASQSIPIADLHGCLWLKVRSGTTGTPVNQGADRILSLLVTMNPVGDI